MPTRLYLTRHEPPTLTDRALAHPFELTVVGAVWFIFGLYLNATWITGSGPSTIISQLPSLAAAVISLVILAGGTFVLLAVLWPGRDSTAWVLEMYGLVFGASAWIGYGIVADGIIWRTLASAYVAGSLVRFLAVASRRKSPPGVVIRDGRAYVNGGG